MDILDLIDRRDIKIPIEEPIVFSYGNDLWDCLPILTENTSTKTNLMK